MVKLKFGELELSILKIVQESGCATVREVYESLGKVGSYTTIMTVMGRLAEKGDLVREKEGRQYLYRSASSKSLLQRLQDKIFGGSSVSLVSYLIDSQQQISDKDLEEMEKLIQKRRLEKKNG